MPRDPLPDEADAAALIAAAAAGRMVVLRGFDARETALVLPAAHVTAEAIAFMAIHGRGLVCLALTAARVAALGLPVMPGAGRGDRPEATVSVEAREGVSTGISAHDRARTIAVAADPATGPEALVTPGHVFPLIAREGGLLARQGMAEAGADLAGLAGLPPAAVICTILDETGEVADAAHGAALAARHGLVVGSVGALLRHRRRTGRLLERRLEGVLSDAAGRPWRAVILAEMHGTAEHLALLHGDAAATPALLLHTAPLARDPFAPPGERLAERLAALGERPAAVVLCLGRAAGDGLAEQLGLNAPVPAAAAAETAAALLRELGIAGVTPVDEDAARVAAGLTMQC